MTDTTVDTIGDGQRRTVGDGEPRSEQPLSRLALRHGLKPAGKRPGLFDYTRQLWKYRHFMVAYANGRLIAAFTTARLGRLWQLLNPIINAAVYYLIFGLILNTKAGIPNFIAYLCTGLFVFAFTQGVVVQGTQAISSSLGLIRALQFPRASLPIAVTLTQFQNLLISMLVLVGIVIADGEPITVEWALVVPALLLQSLFNVGLALAMARMGAKVTDLKQLIPFVMRTWMYASGVLYSVENFARHLPQFWAEVMLANPLLVYIELMRLALLDTAPIASPPLRLWLLGAGWAVVVFVGGFLYFWRGEQDYGRG
jgi:teichoic acid transport system permease protein